MLRGSVLAQLLALGKTEQHHAAVRRAEHGAADDAILGKFSFSGERKDFLRASFDEWLFFHTVTLAVVAVERLDGGQTFYELLGERLPLRKTVLRITQNDGDAIVMELNIVAPSLRPVVRVSRVGELHENLVRGRIPDQQAAARKLPALSVHSGKLG